jgi:hypothetical protein
MMCEAETLAGRAVMAPSGWPVGRLARPAESGNAKDHQARDHAKTATHHVEHHASVQLQSWNASRLSERQDSLMPLLSPA